MDKAEEQERRLQVLEESQFGNTGTFWHSTYTKHGILYGELGAMTHVLDPSTKRAASKGFHEITGHGFNMFTGTVGATRELFTVPRCVVQGYTSHA